MLSGEASAPFAVRSASSVLEALAKRMPSLAHRKRRDDIDNVPLEDVSAGDTLVVRRQGGVELTARYGLPARDPRLAPFLAPEPWIESEHARIQAQARLIVGSEGDPARAARLIHDWVAQHVEPRVTAGGAGAVRVLETRSGDCNERTVLYVALARAAGLPARPVAGLLYRGGRFYYHAWP